MAIRIMKKSQTPLWLILLGAAALILVPTVFTGIGWQTLRLECHREAEGAPPSCEVQNGYFGGLWKTAPRFVDRVTAAGYKNSTLRNTKNFVQMPISTVVLEGGQDIVVFQTSSNVNDGIKKDVIRQVSVFLDNPALLSLIIDTGYSNLFGWIGLPLFLIVWGGLIYTVIFYVRRTISRLLS